MAGYGKQYDTVDDAASAALMWIARQPNAIQQEYMALLFRDPETLKYFRGEFKTSGRRASVGASFEPLGQVAGIVHNHPGMQQQDHYPHTWFSGTDIDQAKKDQVPNYIAAMNEPGAATEKRFRPGKTSVRRTDPRDPLSITYSKGEDFLSQFPIDEFKQLLMREVLGRNPNDPRGLKR